MLYTLSHAILVALKQHISGVNLINVLLAAFAFADLESVKRNWQLDWVLTLWGATGIKAAQICWWNWPLNEYKTFFESLVDHLDHGKNWISTKLGHFIANCIFKQPNLWIGDQHCFWCWDPGGNPIKEI